MISKDRKVKLRQIGDTLKISEGNEYTILHKHLFMRKLVSKWVWRLRTVHQKQQRADDSDRCLELFIRNKHDFFGSVYKNGCNMDLPLHSGIKSTVS